MYRTLFIYFLLFLILHSCSSNEQKFSHFNVQRKDFTHKLHVNGTLEAIRTITIACPRIWADATVSYLIPEGTSVNPGDTVCILKCAEIENKYVDALNDLKRAQIEYEKTEADLKLQFLMLKAQVDIIESSTKIQQLDSTQLRFSSEVNKQLIELNLKKAEIEKNKINKKLKFLKEINQSELQKMKMRIKQAKNKVNRNKSQLDKLTLISENKGIIIYAWMWSSNAKIREGDIVWDRMTIMRIPDLSKMQVRMNIAEAKYKQIEKGQKVNIALDAFHDIKLTGEITKKSPVGKPVSRGSKVKIFEVFSSVDSTGMNLQPGLGTTCDILINQVNDTIVVPTVSIYEFDSSKVVYLLHKGKYIRKPVVTGISNLNETVIQTGLNPNEQISLIEPLESMIIKN